MSDLGSLGDPDHVCGDGCAPYIPLACRDLEDLDESDHIDTLYEVLEKTREHAALLLLALSRAGVESVRIPSRAVALLLDMDEEVVEETMDDHGISAPYPVAEVVDLAVELEGEDGYMGRAITALFRAELETLNYGIDSPDDLDDDGDEE